MMNNPFWNFFKRRTSRTNVEVENIRDQNLEPSPSTEELLIQKLGKENIELLCTKYLLKEEDLSLNFLRLLEKSPTFLDYLLNHNCFYEIIHKLNQRPLLLEDIRITDMEFLQFPIFNEKEEEKLQLLRKDFVLKETNYASIAVNHISKDYSPTHLERQSISSYFKGVEIQISEKLLLPISLNEVGYNDNITLLNPIEDTSKIISKDFFHQYYDGNFGLNSDTIVIFPYSYFLELSDEEIGLLKDCQIILKEDFQQYYLFQQTFLSKNFQSPLKIMPSYSASEENTLIKLNHLLFVIENSSLPENRKKYYSYYLKDYFHKIEDNWAYRGSFHELMLEVVQSIKQEEVKNLTEKFQKLEISEQQKEIVLDPLSVDIFLESLGNIDTINIQFLLYKTHEVDLQFRKQLFDSKEIQQKIQTSILKDSKMDTWKYFRNIFQNISVEELFSMLNEDTFKTFLAQNDKAYILFAAAGEKDFHNLLEVILKKDSLFDEFFKRNSYYSSLFEKLEDYSLLQQIIGKIEKLNCPYRNDFLSSVKKKHQYQLLKEPLEDHTLLWMIDRFHDEVKQFSFLNDERALHYWNHFNIVDYSNKGIKVNPEILKKKEFFEKLKSTSFIDFRNRVNTLQMGNPSMLIEERVKKYHDEILNQFQLESGLFQEYQTILDNPNLLHTMTCDYILSPDIYHKLYQFLEYDDQGNLSFHDHKGRIIQFLKEETNKKLSEVVVDALFQDHIYNVFLNIKEMLRYNKGLTQEKQILNEERIKFYQTILEIDQMDPFHKVKFYQEFKEKNVHFMFYQDLRNLKDLSYKNINDDILKLRDHPEFLEPKKTNQYGVSVYDLRDREYTMLVRSMGNFKDKTNYRRNCYSLISNENTQIFTNPDWAYAYDHVDADCILHVFEGDSYSGDTMKRDNTEAGSTRVNRIITPTEIVKGENWHSEIQIVNKHATDSENMFDVPRPNFIISFDDVCEMALVESKRLGIPIALIKHQKLKEEDVIDMGFDLAYDKYLSNYDVYEEEKFRNRR